MNQGGEPIENTTTIVWMDDAGYLVIRAKGIPSTAETVQETLASVLAITGGKKVPLLIDARNWPSGSPGSLQTMVENMDRLFTAGAMVVDPDNPPALGAFPEIVDRLVVPFRMVHSVEEGRAFLMDNAD